MDKNWQQFEKTGSISDYLTYRGIFSEIPEKEEQHKGMGAEEYGNNHSTDGDGPVCIAYR